jgi:hypothetical protein
MNKLLLADLDNAYGHIHFRSSIIPLNWLTIIETFEPANTILQVI